MLPENPYNILVLVCKTILYLICDLENYQLINLCCFSPEILQ